MEAERSYSMQENSLTDAQLLTPAVSFLSTGRGQAGRQDSSKCIVLREHTGNPNRMSAFPPGAGPPRLTARGEELSPLPCISY